MHPGQKRKPIDRDIKFPAVAAVAALTGKTPDIA